MFQRKEALVKGQICSKQDDIIIFYIFIVYIFKRLQFYHTMQLALMFSVCPWFVGVSILILKGHIALDRASWVYEKRL